MDSPEATSTAEGSSADAAVSSPARVDVAGASELAAATNGALDQTGGGPGNEIAPAGEAVEERGCVQALTEHAESRPTLEEHVADADKPEGGGEGNQNALDKQCGWRFRRWRRIVASAQWRRRC